MIVKFSDIVKAPVKQSPITGEKYVVVRVGKDVVRVRMEA